MNDEGGKEILRFCQDSICWLILGDKKEVVVEKFQGFKSGLLGAVWWHQQETGKAGTELIWWEISSSSYSTGQIYKRAIRLEMSRNRCKWETGALEKGQSYWHTYNNIIKTRVWTGQDGLEKSEVRMMPGNKDTEDRRGREAKEVTAWLEREWKPYRFMSRKWRERRFKE